MDTRTVVRYDLLNYVNIVFTHFGHEIAFLQSGKLYYSMQLVPLQTFTSFVTRQEVSTTNY